ncbi:hypothetical protein BH10ACI3_BH10ACI3_24480 [soil metagenome]
MYCIKCGADNLETAKFCRKCGEAVDGAAVGTEAEVETRVAVRKAEAGGTLNTPIRDGMEAIADEAKDAELDEPVIFSISPTLMFVKAGYVLAAFCALLLVAIFAAFTSVSAWVAVLIGLLLFLVPGYFHIRQKLVRYTLTHSKLEVDSGLISRTTRNIPIRRIQDVTFTASVTQRLLGFGDLVIDNASEEGGKVVMKNINSPKQYADILLKQMSRLDN